MALAASYTKCLVAALLAAAAGAAHVGHIVPLGAHVAHHHRHWHHEPGFMQHRAAKRHLRICNAYPSAAALDVLHSHRERLTRDGPMPYKSCRDFSLSLGVGDKIEFKMHGHSAGIFVVQTLPGDHAVLLLVIQRHDTVSTAVSFQSHVFANHPNAQVAIIDTYKGSGNAKATISHEQAESAGKPLKTQLLRYDTFVSLSQGMYTVKLAEDGRSLQTSELVALGRENYVVLRTGIEPEEGESFPEELVVFPLSNESKLYEDLDGRPNGAYARPWLCCLLVALAAAVAVVPL